MNEQIKDRVIKVVNKVTGKNVESLNPDSELKSQLNLDSIQLVELFAALETELGIELPLEMMMINKAGGFLERLEEELNQQIL